MSLLFFKHVFKPAILAGAKTTTLRRWSRPRCRAGQRVYAPGIGPLRVLSIERVRLRDLRAADAHADGFATLRSLRTTLAELYPDRHQLPLYKIRFRVDT